jgi:hypothetical protein
MVNQLVKLVAALIFLMFHTIELKDSGMQIDLQMKFDKLSKA